MYKQYLSFVKQITIKSIAKKNFYLKQNLKEIII